MSVPKIAKDEREIRCKWHVVGGRVQGDEGCQRIDELTSGYLRKLEADPSGWEMLFVDPEDGRYWELTYPESALHGGGPPLLRNLTREEARSKYRALRT